MGDDKNHTAWCDVMRSLVAAGVEERLALGVVDILIKNNTAVSTAPLKPLVLSKEQMLYVPEIENTSKLGAVDQLSSRLFSDAKIFFAQLTQKRSHTFYQYCKNAVLIERRGQNSSKG